MFLNRPACGCLPSAALPCLLFVSSDLNPIKQAFADFKAAPRHQAERTRDALAGGLPHSRNTTNLRSTATSQKSNRKPLYHRGR